MSENIIKSLERSLKLINCLSEKNCEISVSSLSKMIGIPPSSIQRILNTLKKWQIVEQNHGNLKYRLGVKLFEWGSLAFSEFEIRRIALPYMEKLSRKTRETVHLVILDKKEWEGIYITKVDNVEIMGLRLYTRIGMRLSLHCTAVGKVLLSGLSEEELSRFFKEKELEKHTDNTITDKEKLREHLGEIKRCGYAVDDRENFPDIRCVAAPIRNHEGKIIAGISLSGPISRMTMSQIKQKFVPFTKETTQSISKRLGYREKPVMTKGL